MLDLHQKARKVFDQIKFVRCPCFPKEKIVFNAKGINHLFYNGPRSKRSHKEIETRLKLLPRAVELLQKMPIPQEESKIVKESRTIKFWAFEGVIEERRIKVIVRQIGNGQKHFWSVIPFWRRNRFGVKNAGNNLPKL